MKFTLHCFPAKFGVQFHYLFDWAPAGAGARKGKL